MNILLKKNIGKQLKKLVKLLSFLIKRSLVSELVKFFHIFVIDLTLKKLTTV